MLADRLRPIDGRPIDRRPIAPFLARAAARILLPLAGALALAGAASGAAAQELPLSRLQAPPGFTVELLARVPNARQMVLGDERVLYVGSMREGRVHALPLDAAFRAAGPVQVVDRGLQMPSGVAFREGSLYVAAVNRILRYDGITRAVLQRGAAPKATVVADDLPSETHHGWKFIAFGPDGLLYVPVGAPCNVCEVEGDRHAVLLRMRPDGSQREVVARGVRNSVGFDWQPGTGALWFTDNGRDMLGDDVPPDELNQVSRTGDHFGFPYCHAGRISDPEFGTKRPCSDFTAPAQALGAHVAPLGMRFYGGSQFPAAYRGRVFIAEHGSWNRSRKSGYRVTTVTVKDGRAVAYEPFLTGWLQDEQAWGRPADVLVLPDGSLLVSDDEAGAIYRVRHTKP